MCGRDGGNVVNAKLSWYNGSDIYIVLMTLDESCVLMISEKHRTSQMYNKGKYHTAAVWTGYIKGTYRLQVVLQLQTQ